MSNLISARLFVKNCNLLQEAGSVRLHQKLEIEVKTQGFVGSLSALDRGYPKFMLKYKSQDFVHA